MLQPVQYKPFNASLHDVPSSRQVIHRQIISITNKATFDIELSWEKMHFYIIAKRKMATQKQGQSATAGSPRKLREHYYSQALQQKELQIKTLWLSQAKQLLKLFDVNMTAMVNGLIKINNDMQIDFTFIDKILLNMVGIQKEKLIEALHVVETNAKDSSMVKDPSKLSYFDSEAENIHQSANIQSQKPITAPEVKQRTKMPAVGR